MLFGIFQVRQTQLNSQIANSQYEIMQITNQLEDVSYISSCIGDGQITTDEISGATNINVSQSLLKFKTSLDNCSFDNSAGASTQLGGNPYEYQQQTRNSIVQNQLSQLAFLEKQLKQKKTRLETQLKIYEQELQSTEQAKDSSIQSSRPNYS